MLDTATILRSRRRVVGMSCEITISFSWYDYFPLITTSCGWHEHCPVISGGHWATTPSPHWLWGKHFCCIEFEHPAFLPSPSEILNAPLDSPDHVTCHLVAVEIPTRFRAKVGPSDYNIIASYDLTSTVDIYIIYIYIIGSSASGSL